MKILSSLLYSLALSSKIKIENEQFELNGQRSVVSGANQVKNEFFLEKLKTNIFSKKLGKNCILQAWHWYSYDFGNGEFWKEPGDIYKANIGTLFFYIKFI